MTRLGARGAAWTPGVAAALLGLSACGEGRLLLSPAVPPGAAAMLVLVERPGERRIHAAEPAAGAFTAAIDLPPPYTVTALAYPEPLARFGLEPGLVPPAGPGEPEASLPPPAHVQEGRVEAGGAFSGWRVLTDDPPSARIPTRGPAACLEEGGCFPALPREGAPLCVLPCPSPEPPADPRPPAAPQLTPRPPGWVVTSTQGVDFALPWPRAAPPCPSGEIRTPERPSCAALSPCALPSELPDGVAFVDPEAARSGDGTRARPFRELERALAPPEVDALALAPGTHEAPRLPARDLRLIGVCPDRTRVRLASARVPPDVLWALTSVALESPRRIEVDGRLELDRVRVEADLVSRGAVEAERLEVRGRLWMEAGRARFVDAHLQGPVGLRVDGGTLELEGVDVAAESAALHVGPAAEVVAARTRLAATDDAVVRVDGRLRGRRLVIDGRGTAHGVRVAERGAASLEASALVDTNAWGVFVDGGRLGFVDGVVRVAEDGDVFGYGVHVRGEGQAELTRVAVVGAAGRGLRARGRSSGLGADDVQVLETRPTRDPRQSLGVGISIGAGASFRAARVVVRGAHDTGVKATGQNTNLEIRDLRVEDVRGRFVSGRDGQGVEVDDEAQVDLERVLIRRATAAGILVEGTPTRLSATDLQIASTRPARACSGSNCSFGRSGAMRVELVAQARVERFAFEDNGAYGLVVTGAAEVDLREGRIAGQERGLILTDPDYPAARLAERVRILDAVQAVVVLGL